MATTILLALLATSTKARLMPPLPPIVVRDGLEDVYNTIAKASISVGRNMTYPGAEMARNYDTAAYKIYIAFVVFGTVSATLLLPAAYSPNLIHWWRQKKHQKSTEQRKENVAEATMRTRETHESTPLPPPRAHVRPERAVRPGTNFF